MSFRYLDLKRAYPFQISLYFFFQFFLAAINHNPSFKTHEPILSQFSFSEPSERTVYKQKAIYISSGHVSITPLHEINTAG